ncbi:beta-lactamase [Novimethylophilus kurashikiensis]|uniref:Beta-lactamase n=1 Tax=Novimethylophilus kurashikiensis TaxID=1825523 RepID=A0A2R5FBU3_9PROT|nr:quinoprotein relay system zinc metallohydrolase 2 [Novimethylophilus kurashikiensis]GBG15309.1 beta-lactamase [Novimethylophilus kurashikiensis]
MQKYPKLATCCLGLICLIAFASARAEALAMEKVADGVYVHHGVHEELDEGYHGDICNIGFIVGKKGVAVVDSGGSYRVGMQLREAIRKVTDLPILYVINTHVHPDHIFGNAAFKADQPIFVGHAKLADAMELRKETYLRNNQAWLGEAFAGSEMIKPALAVASKQELDLGERTLSLQAWPPAHTSADLTVLDQKTGTLWTGDLLFVERTPSMDGDTLSWLKIIPDLEKLPAQLAIPGHGAVTKEWQAAMEKEKHYFEILLADIRSNIKQGISMEKTMETAAAGERTQWVLFDSVNRRNVNILYPKLEWE